MDMTVIVTCRAPGGRRRAGRRWPEGETIADLGTAAIAAIEADPAFAVGVRDQALTVTAPAPAPATPAPATPAQADPATARADTIRLAIAGLAPEGFTQAGPPRLDALRRAAGLADITDPERDAAWAAHQESHDDKG